MGNEKIQRFHATIKAVESLTRKGSRVGQMRDVLKQNAEQEQGRVVNTDTSVMDAFLPLEEFDVALLFDDNTTELNSAHTLSGSKEYTYGGTYNLLEVFTTAIQFFDDYESGSLPTTTLPPMEDLQTFIDEVFNEEGLVTIEKQLKILLKITNNNLLKASNIAMLATRIMARNSDTRAYPGIFVSSDQMVSWAKKLAPFEIHGDVKEVDSSGDAYYFWTYMFLTLAMKKSESRVASVVDKITGRGTQIMRFVRQYFAGQPTISPHAEASLLGRNIALALCEV